ncbi:hypothetical protein RI054_24g101700 [Pseudoscourfieldia marina]
MGGTFASSFEPALYDLTRRIATAQANNQDNLALQLQTELSMLKAQLMAGCGHTIIKCENCMLTGHDTAQCPRPSKQANKKKKRQKRVLEGRA